MNIFKVYQITNNINNMIYIGVTTADIDSYHGSGVALKEAYKVFDKSNFTKKVLFTFDNKEDMLAKEAELVNKEFVNRDDTYNLIPGGGGFNNLGMVIAKDDSGEYKMISSDEYAKGDYTTPLSGLVTVKNPDGDGYINISQAEYHKADSNYSMANSGHVTVFCPELRGYKNITSEEYAKGKYKHASSGRINVEDINRPGRYVSIPVELYDKTIHKTVNSGMVRVKNPNMPNSTISVTVDEYADGGYEHINTGTVTARCTKTGVILRVSKNDPRWKTGLIEGNIKGLKWVNNGVSRKRIHKSEIDSYLQNGYKLGKKFIE